MANYASCDEIGWRRSQERNHFCDVNPIIKDIIGIPTLEETSSRYNVPALYRDCCEILARGLFYRD